MRCMNGATSVPKSAHRYVVDKGQIYWTVNNFKGTVLRENLCCLLSWLLSCSEGCLIHLLTLYYIYIMQSWSPCCPAEGQLWQPCRKGAETPGRATSQFKTHRGLKQFFPRFFWKVHQLFLSASGVQIFYNFVQPLLGNSSLITLCNLYWEIVLL